MKKMLNKQLLPNHNRRISREWERVSLAGRELEVKDFGQYLKFVNREQQCRQCVNVFFDLYRQLRGRQERTWPSQPAHSPSSSQDLFNKYFPIVVCAGAPGVGHDSYNTFTR